MIVDVLARSAVQNSVLSVRIKAPTQRAQSSVISVFELFPATEDTERITKEKLAA
jgi:hypothetical protein